MVLSRVDSTIIYSWHCIAGNFQGFLFTDISKNTTPTNIKLFICWHPNSIAIKPLKFNLLVVV